MLINSFITYADIDSVIAKAAVTSFKRHLWYITEELAPLALYSNEVDNNTKQKMADKILKASRDRLCSKRHGSGFGKPSFCKMPTIVSNDISAFIGDDSWSFFHITGLDDSFLNTPVAQWEANNAYQQGKLIVNNIRVVNDSAERGVKLCQDFSGSAHKEKHFQSILQVVENSRHTLPKKKEPGVFILVSCSKITI